MASGAALLADELDVLCSIYPECSVSVQSADDTTTVVLPLSPDDGGVVSTPLRLIIDISTAYPGEDGSLTARVQVSGAGVDAAALDTLRATVAGFCQSHGADECLVDLILLATEVYEAGLKAAVQPDSATDRKSAGPACDETQPLLPARRCRYLLRVDHMNSPKSYCATLASWCSELNISGCILSCLRGRLGILILIDGTPPAIKEYLRRHRTQYVDIDKRGTKCKERLLDVLVGPLDAVAARVCTSFEVVEPLETPADVKDVLHSYAICLPE